MEKDSPIPPVDKVATELTGGGTLEAAAEAAAERKAAIVKGGSEVRLCKAPALNSGAAAAVASTSYVYVGM